MRFSAATVSAALFGAAMAAPAARTDGVSTESITIQNFKSIPKDLSKHSPIIEVSFELVSHRKEGVKAYVCSASNPDGLTPDDSPKCANYEQTDGYSFQYLATGQYATYMQIFHQTGPAVGRSGFIVIPAQCTGTCQIEEVLHV
ncbi:hypothetical protein MAPG_01453 [Magnaporthiopsis poae ATCC 64411]|uniref:AA1-like domain-containing protein n=1 Tax=Magnaporthiopsis poae (strain ATCC 64411 / 73-15) TaxID=644358 RepID=A0A0C4DNQ9_MAGP6|nr:hypothetical protein MAPG_01453 [Magnaporthiopsis poae ATCC 64411]